MLRTFHTETQESLPPDEDKAGEFFARIGYRITDAIADLVDNSIDAGADKVHIRFLRSPAGIHSVIIADNGSGMSAEELREAMRFGSRSNKSASQLGKYGIGLKSASLSQADTVIVLTKHSGKALGRRWTKANVKSGWTSDILRSQEVEEALSDSFGEFKIRRSGTVIIWEELEHLRALPDHVDEVLERTRKELNTELGIRFHRFLESNRLSLSIDELDIGDAPGLPVHVTALDPFGYEESPRKEYPLKLRLKVGNVQFVAECHIWPPRTKSPNYRLGGGKVALRQGFYFYRNDRVIQAGGWNQIRADDGEPHFSLARVRVELPAELDSLFKLDITKSRLDPSPSFTRALLDARSNDLTFSNFIEDAQTVYRRQKAKEGASFPLIPGKGFSKNAQKAIASLLKERGTDKPSKVTFKWERLGPQELVRLSPGEYQIALNSRFRKDLSEGGSRDAPVLMLALMFLLQDEIEKKFLTKVSEERIQRINLALIAAINP